MTDTITRFIFEKADIRGEIAHLDETYQKLLSFHHYPPLLKQLLGEALLAAVLMTATIKFKGQLTLQLQTNQVIKLLLVKCSHDFKVRALIQFDKDESSEKMAHALQEGKLVITIEPDDKVRPYQSIVPLQGNSLAQALEYYFAQSEQLTTKFNFAVSDGKASGMLLQLLPEHKKSEQREEFWQYATKIGDTLSNDELQTLDNETILYRLYHETNLRLFESATVAFYCPCSKERMARAIQTLGEEEAKSMLKQQQTINVHCEFCLQNYAFDKVDIEWLFHQKDD